MKNCFSDNQIACLFEKGTNFTITGFIIFHSKEYVFLKYITIGCYYSGYALNSLRDVYKVSYDSTNVLFYKEVLGKPTIDYYLSNPKEMVELCYKEKRCLEVSQLDWSDYSEVLLILEVKDDAFVGKRIDENGDFYGEITIKYNDVRFMIFDTPLLKNYEKYIRQKYLNS